MPHPTKKQRIECYERNVEVAVADDDFLASFDDLSIDVLANVLAFLAVEDICLNDVYAKSVERR